MDVLTIGLFVLAVLLLVAGGSVGIAAARPGADPRAVAARALGIVGALAVGAGTILFFAANWSDMPRALRFAVLLGGLTAAYVAALWLLEVRRSRRNVGHGLALVGAVLFGASIFLVGQTYHVEAHEPLGFLAWSLGALATALFFRSSPAAGLALLTFEGWLVYELLDSEGYESPRSLPFVLALYGLALYTLGTAARRWLAPLGLDGAMRVVGFSLAAFTILGLSFRYLYSLAGPRPHGLPLVILIACTTVALAAAALLATQRRGLGLLEPALAAAATVLVLVAALVPEGGNGEEYFLGARVYPLLFTGLAVAVLVGAIVLGSLREQLWLSSAAIVIGSLAILLHFLDFTWTRLPRSFVFLGVGGLILGLAAVLDRQADRAR